VEVSGGHSRSADRAGNPLNVTLTDNEIDAGSSVGHPVLGG
jgi:hypothetical protein